MNTDKIINWLFGDRIPLTKSIIVVNGLTFMAAALFGAGPLLVNLIYMSASVRSMPWTLVTYPLIGGADVLGLVFQCYWLWMAGGSLERSWGTRNFATYFFLMSAISVLGLFVGGMIGGVPTSAIGLWLPVAGLTVAYAMLNPEQQILFFFVLPLKLKYLAMIDVAIVLVTYGRPSLALGVLALSGCAYSYWRVRPGRLAWSAGDRGQVVRVHRKRGLMNSLNPFGWIKGYRERKKLKDLFKRSGWDE